WLPQYEGAIARVKERQNSKERIPTRKGYRGAARLPVKTVEEMAANRQAATKNAGAANKAQKLPTEI
ncbi:MAG TPA: alpha-glucosidase/alpha-galactosidase, partial [Firmicutes bacterium]|nr:alpha-glucosidase/alpha-galactosidase [Bacillota bacterium]